MGKFLVLVMLLAPLAGAGIVALLGSANLRLVRQVSLLAALVALACALGIAARYQPATNLSPAAPFHGDPQFEIQHVWLTYHAAGPGQAPPQLHLHLAIDGLSLWLIALTALLTVSAVLVSWNAITEAPAAYYALLLLLATGMLGVFCAYDLILFYVFFEFTLLPLFFIIGIWGGPQKRYAARKFFIYTLTGSLIALVGLVALVLSLASGNEALTFSIPELARRAGSAPLSADAQKWIFLALFAGFAVKVPLFPLHTWLPLAHVEAPTAGSVLLAGVLLKLGTYGFLRLCLPMVPLAVVEIGVPLVGTLAVIGILYGSLCALAQDDMKKLVAYSSIAHLGFCMLGLFALNAAGICGGLLQMINHGLSTGLLFLLVGMVYERYHVRRISAFGGLARRLPLLGAVMVFTCLASAGLPGLNGFVGEFLCLAGMYKVRPSFTVFAALGIILGAWYLLGMLRAAFFGPLREPGHGHNEIRDLDGRECAAVLPLAALCLLIGLFPQPLINAMRPEVSALAQRLQTVQENLSATRR
jgi:NADH-quinone oxidoreductase subunit M